MGVGPETDSRQADEAVFGASLFGSFALTDCDGAAVAISSARARAVLAMICLVRARRCSASI